MRIIVSVGIFILAGLFEIGGGCLIWFWLREAKMEYLLQWLFFGDGR